MLMIISVCQKAADRHGAPYCTNPAPWPFVVLHFPANTVNNRLWMRSIFEGADADHRLHWLDMPDELCRMRLHQRNEKGTHEFSPTDEDFDRITRLFMAPTPEEGFQIVRLPTRSRRPIDPTAGLVIRRYGIDEHLHDIQSVV